MTKKLMPLDDVLLRIPPKPPKPPSRLRTYVELFRLIRSYRGTPPTRFRTCVELMAVFAVVVAIALCDLACVCLEPFTRRRS